MRAKARQNLNQNNMASHAYKPGELFRRLHLDNVQQSEENQAYSGIVSEEDPMESHRSTVNNFTLPSRPSIAQAGQGKRKASENKEQSTAPKKTKKNPKNKAWSADQVELLLRYLKDFKRSATLMESISRPTWALCIRRYVGVWLPIFQKNLVPRMLLSL